MYNNNNDNVFFLMFKKILEIFCFVKNNFSIKTKKGNSGIIKKLKKIIGFGLLYCIKAVSVVSIFLNAKFKKILVSFDRICCCLGVCILKDVDVIYLFIKSLGLHCKKFFKISRDKFITSCKLFAARNGIDWSKRINSFKTTLNGISVAYTKGFKAFLVHIFFIFVNFLSRFFRCIFGSINYFAPILGLCCFVVVISVTLDMTFALEVKYNGKSIGYIAEESVFDDAEREVFSRIVLEDYIMPEETIPEFSITAINGKELSNEHSITNEIIKASGNELSFASGLYIDDKFFGAVANPVSLDNLLNKVKKQFATGDENEEIEFVKNVECREGLYPVSSVVSLDYIDGTIRREESQKRVYTTVSGDSPILIAQKNGIPYSQLKALNPEIETKLLVGQEVMVEKAVPMLEVKVVRTVVEEEDVNFKVEQIQDSGKYQGYVKIIQKGEKGVEQVYSKVTYVDGIETEREILSTKVIKEPVNEKVKVGGKRPLSKVPTVSRATSDYFRWPCDGGAVTCLFGNAGYWGHTGLDIGRMPTGSPIRASAAGTVVKVRYDTWNYGYHVIIDHGGNVQTLYAHNSKIYVKVGDWVEQGQLIAGMGRTGRATGVHVHFEVRVNGRYMNPANYVGLKSPF